MVTTEATVKCYTCGWIVLATEAAHIPARGVFYYPAALCQRCNNPEREEVWA